MELRSRSRSKTPFLVDNFIAKESEESHSTIITRSARKSTITSRVTEIGSPMRPVSRRTSKLLQASAITSDYSSEEGEFDTASHISQNDKNQIIEDAKKAANGDSQISALNLYRNAGRYWDKYPKTDWTYSPSSRDRVEIAPGVVQMPNMSRRSIHTHDSSTNTDFVQDTLAIKKKLFSTTISSGNNNETIDESYRISRGAYRSTASSVSVFRRVYLTLFSWIYAIYSLQNGFVINVVRKLYNLTLKIMLLDTWLLKKSAAAKRTRLIIALCVLPLILFTGWWLFTNLASAIIASHPNPSKITHPPERIPHPTVIDAHDTDLLIEKILTNPKLINNINNYHINSQNSAENTINKLREELRRVSNDLNELLATYRTENAQNIALLSTKIDQCCRRPAINLQAHISRTLTEFLNNPTFLSKQAGLNTWLKSLFLAREELENRIRNVTIGLNSKYASMVDDTAEKVMASVIAKMEVDFVGAQSGLSLSEKRVQEIVNRALKVYDADRTGMADYAMEGMGAEIVTTRCTEAFHTTKVLKMWGVPLWYPFDTPRVAIQPGTNPGECWPFQNFPGFLVIKLAHWVRIEAFSMEHISRLMVSDGKIDSAPKAFEVYGLVEENDKRPVKIGAYVYDYDGEGLQFFGVDGDGVYSMIELRILSNHGNPNYTCLYRFRVHGKVVAREEK